jgi:hypothetical protein
VRALGLSGLVVLGGAGFACSSSQATATLKIVTVDDPFTGPPAAATLDVDAIDVDGGAITSLAKGAPIAQATVDLGDLSTDLVASFRVQARDSGGNVVAWGLTIPWAASDLASATLPIFVQRTGQLARMPGTLPDARTTPLLGVLEGGYVVLAGGDDPTLASQTAIYDLGAWALLASPPVLPRAPLSMAVVGLQVLAVDGAGASWLDLGSSTSTGATLPPGGQWADVAGGATVVADDGTAYVVGATRATGAPTSAVLVASTNGQLSFASLASARLGAAAAWVQGKGLVVAGGSATAAGVEVLAAGAAAGAALAYPPDPTVGGGADPLDATHVVLAGGAANGATPDTRAVDLGCTASCAPSVWPNAKPGVELVVAQAFATGASSALVLGDDASGASHAFTVGPNLTQEIAFKVARNHARGVRLPTGAVAVAGGANVMEELAPQP